MAELAHTVYAQTPVTANKNYESVT